MRKIALFGGTFDPIHNGHLHLALTLRERHQLDQVIFLPSAQNPLKTEKAATAKDRVKMLHLALEELPFFSIDEREIERGGVSYTVDTLSQFRSELREKDQLFLLMGEDVLPRFHEWKDFEGIIELATPLVMARSSAKFRPLPHVGGSVEKKLREGFTVAPLMEISATEIRNRLNMSLFCGHLLPAKVLDHIHRNQLYFSREKGTSAANQASR